MTTEAGRQRWSDVDLRRAFNTDRLSHAYAVQHEGGYAPQSIEIADKLRNVLVLLPILLTWFALGAAVDNYAAFYENNPDRRDLPFLIAWQRGFGEESTLLTPSLSHVAFVDAIIIAAIILLTFYAHGRREAQEDKIADTASEFQAEFDNALAEAGVLLATDRSSRPVRLADAVERMADSFEESSQSLLTQLEVQNDRMEHVAGRREKEFTDFGVFATGMRAGAEEMHRLIVDLRDVSTGLGRALEDLSTDVARSGDQQRSLLLAVTNLEKMTSSSIQNDQAVSRQLSQAVARLSETAETTITGAESAAQAGRVALDAVRGISAIAEDISASQSRVDRALSNQNDAATALAESLRQNTSGTQSTALRLTEIGQGLATLSTEFERISSHNAQQINALNALMQQQTSTGADLSGVIKDLGNIAINSAQKQREINEALRHLLQRLDGLATTLNHVAAQQPGTISAQRRPPAVEEDDTSAEQDRPTGRWTRR